MDAHAPLLTQLRSGIDITPDEVAAPVATECAGAFTSSSAALPFSIFELFSLGIGPSSSHTVGPMRAARAFVDVLAEFNQPVTRITVDLMGSLGATGRGHATDQAVLLGLAGYTPENVPSEVVEGFLEGVATAGSLKVPGVGTVPLMPEEDITFSPGTILRHHVNALSLKAWAGSALVVERTYYSIGGGFVMEEVGQSDGSSDVIPVGGIVQGEALAPVPYPYSCADELLAACETSGKSISAIVYENECANHEPESVCAYIDQVWATMCECIDAGCNTEGYLPGRLRVRRRAAALKRRLDSAPKSDDALAGMDWVNLYALAVNEENAAGHRIVTAPTNGAAGVVPAVLKYYTRFLAQGEEAKREGVRKFLLAATAVGGLIKANASIAGAEVGCQGEVGSACAMAAAGLAEALGGTPLQVENAAEIAMEHCLGLTCDPVGGLVQIPCIERNAIAAVKAINAARMALWGDGRHLVSLDTVISTMRETGRDMLSKYKETSQGGLAVHVIEC